MELDPTGEPSGWDVVDYKHFSVCGSDTSETETDTDTESCTDSTANSQEGNKPPKFNKKIKDMKGFEKIEYKKILVEEELLPE